MPNVGIAESLPLKLEDVRLPRKTDLELAELPKITTPTAAEIAVKSKPSPQGKALITPGMTPSQHLHVLEKNKLSMDSVGLLAHGLPPMDAICWACQGCRLVGPAEVEIKMEPHR